MWAQERSTDTFDSKEGIVNTLYQHLKQELGSQILSKLDDASPPRMQFHVYWSTLADFVLKNPSAFKFLELHHHSEYLDDASLQIEAGFTEMARVWMENFQAQHVVKDADPYILMSIVHGAFVGIFKACGENHLVASPEAIETAEQCVWEAIRR